MSFVQLVEDRLKQVIEAADGEAERLASEVKVELTAQAEQIKTNIEAKVTQAKTDIANLIKAGGPTLEADATKLVDTLLQDVLAELGGGTPATGA